MSDPASQHRPRHNWTPLIPTRLRTAQLFSDELAPLGLSADAVYRGTSSGFVVRWGPRGARMSAEVLRDEVTAAEMEVERALRDGAQFRCDLRRHVDEAGESPAPRAFLALLIAERRRLKIPRGANVEAASNTLVIRTAAQELCEWIQLEELTAGVENGRLGTPWIQALRQKAEKAGGWHTPAELTAYAIAQVVDWKQAQLRSPIQGVDLDVDYFTKQYLDGEVVTSPDGRRLAEFIRQSLMPQRRVAPLDPVRKRLAERMSARFRQMLTGQ